MFFLDEFLTQKEVASLLKVAMSTIHRWRASGMPFIKIDKAVRFNKDDVIKWLKSKEKPFIGRDKIPLTKGKYALIDEDMYDYLMQWVWNCSHFGYAVRSTYDKETKKNGKVQMSRQILGTNNDLQVDHINGNKLDNRRCNLRECTAKQNKMNSPSQKNTTSCYLGVSWDKQKNKWRASIGIDYKTHLIGRYDSEREAAIAYNNKAKELFNEYARLNVIED